MAKNPPASAADKFYSWSRKIPYASGQLSPHTMIPEAHALQNPSFTTKEATAMRSLYTSTRE